MSKMDFSIAASASAISGELAAEGRATFTALSPAVRSGKLAASDQLLLASSAANVGVMGELQAERAVDRLQKLAAVDAAAFAKIADNAASPLERAFVFKALATGRSLADIASFEKTIHDWSSAKLFETLSLADPFAGDATQNGIAQQFSDTCMPTSEQALHGQIDPIYSLQVRSENSDVHRFDASDGKKLNLKLATEEAALYKSIGGTAVSRDSKKTPNGPDARAGMKVFNAVARESGVTFVDKDLYVLGPGKMTVKDDKMTNAALDVIATQLERGIPTPLAIGGLDYAEMHCMLALSVQGAGQAQVFTIHDPWSGNTFTVTRAQFVAGKANMGPNFQVLGGYGVAAVKK